MAVDKAIAMYCGTIGCELSDLEGVDMRYFWVVHMTSDRHLFVANSCVCDAGAVWVDNKWE
jgi:hypothetical protein